MAVSQYFHMQIFMTHSPMGAKAVWKTFCKSQVKGKTALNYYTKCDMSIKPKWPVLGRLGQGSHSPIKKDFPFLQSFQRIYHSLKNTEHKQVLAHLQKIEEIWSRARVNFRVSRVMVCLCVGFPVSLYGTSEDLNKNRFRFKC